MMKPLPDCCESFSGRISLKEKYWVAFSIDMNGALSIVFASPAVLEHINEYGPSFEGHPGEPGFYQADAKFNFVPSDGWEREQSEYFSLSNVREYDVHSGPWEPVNVAADA